MACLRPVIEDIDFATGTLPWDRLQSLEITMDHFRQAMAEVEPSAIREVFVEVPDVSWDDIGGLGRVKRRLVEAVEWPLQHAALFAEAGARAPKGVLLAGPPGVGKTMLAKAAATQCGANFISVKGPELVSKYVGESERALREVFRKARQAAPCIIFFDEIDALLPKRGQGENPVAERLLSQFLAELDGVEELKSVLVLAATNRLDMLDPAVLRPGRFDEVVELEHPDEAARAEVYRVHLRGKPVAEGVDPADLAARSPGASGAQIFGVVQRAAMECVRRRVHSGGAGPLRIEPTDIDAAIEAELRF